MEIWRPCVGLEGLYEVSNLGSVRSVERMVPHYCGGLKKSPSKILKAGKGKNGYLTLSLCVDGEKSNHSVHRLVALAFIENPCHKTQVNHRDGNKYNNSSDNLEWVTASENTKHAYSVLNVFHYKRQSITAELNELKQKVNA